MLVNKWALVALGALMAVVGFLSTQNWTALLPAQDAGYVVMALGVIKMIISGLMPPPGQKTIVSEPAAGGLITHT